ncbi:AraC family transcriptional regulator [Kitasatospora sp. NPDC001540]|uniref:AraC family transcriptional regulator n=1 Tax=Kitasatospora sp. NPDC001540 TaxID=3364014 RepID=UPI0036A00EE4
MVEKGQHDAGGAVGIIDLAYANPRRPRLGLEVLGFDELRHRLLRDVARRPSRVDFHQLLLVRGGHGTAMVDFVTHPCGPGTLLHLRPGQVQRFPHDPESGALAALDAVLLLFTPVFPPPTAAVTALLDDPGPAARQLPPAEYGAFDDAVTGIAAEYGTLGRRGDDADTLTVELLRHLLGALLLRTARLPHPDPHPDPPAAPAPDAELLRAFRREVERSHAVTRSVREYAARLGYSPRTLTRACRAATGLSPKQLVDARVALEARRLLAHTDLPVAAIGRALGFSEPTNFGKFFARETGDTPGDFRRTHR